MYKLVQFHIATLRKKNSTRYYCALILDYTALIQNLQYSVSHRIVLNSRKLLSLKPYTTRISFQQVVKKIRDNSLVKKGPIRRLAPSVAQNENATQIFHKVIGPVATQGINSDLVPHYSRFPSFFFRFPGAKPGKRELVQVIYDPPPVFFFFFFMLLFSYTRSQEEGWEC